MMIPVPSSIRKLREIEPTGWILHQLCKVCLPYARVGSGDPVRVLRLFHNKYSGYCCIHLLYITTYNLSLPRLSATSTTGCLRLCNSGLPARADVHCSVSRGQLPRYCTVPALNGIFLGPFILVLFCAVSFGLLPIRFI